MSIVYGLPCDDLPEGWTPLEAICLIKCLDEEGYVSMYMATTDNLSAMESVGMLDGALDVQRQQVRQGFTSEEEEDEE